MATLCMALAVLGFLALLGWGSFLAADNHLAYLILWVIIVILWTGKLVLQWRETRRFPRSTGAVVASVVLALLSILAPSWPWLRPAACVLGGLFAAFFLISHHAQNIRSG